jgi:hypothetical protein
MARQKVVDGVYMDLSEAEEAELDQRADEADQDLSRVRQERNQYLDRTDRVMIDDFPHGTDTVEDWQTYRQELRDYMSAQTRISTQTAWPKSPIITSAGQAAYDAESDDDLKDAARTAAETIAGYPGPGI